MARNKKNTLQNPIFVVEGITVSAGTSSADLSSLEFDNANGVTFGLNGSTVTASVAAPAATVAIAAGTQTATSGTVVFSNSNGVSFGMSNNSVVTASVASSLTNINVSAGTTSNNLSAITFSNSNNVSFGLNGSTVTATVTVATSLTNINFSAGTTSNNLSAVTFSNANGVSFGLNASTVTASVATSLTNVNVSAGTTSNNLSAVTFSNSNGVSFGLNGSTVTGSVATSLTNINVSAGTTSNNLSAITFSNSNGVSFGLNGSTVTASVAAGAAPTIQFWDNAPEAIATIENMIANGSLSIFPLAIPYWVFPGNMTVNTWLIDMSNGLSTASNQAKTFSLIMGVYTVSASSTLNLLNSVASTWSIAASDSANISKSYSGQQFLTIHSSQFSAQPVFSQTQYYIGAKLLATNNDIAMSFIGFNQNLGLTAGVSVTRFGTVGAATSNATSRGYIPFAGELNTGALPASIHNSAIFKQDNNSGVPRMVLNNLFSVF